MAAKDESGNGPLDMAAFWLERNCHKSIIRSMEAARKSKVQAAWFVTPKNTIIEWIVASVIFIIFFGYLPRGEPTFMSWTFNPSAVRGFDFWDWLLAIPVLIHPVVLIYFKVKTDRVWFMLQPCNFWTLALVYIHFSRSAAAAYFQNIYLHLMWGSWMGLVAADLRDYKNTLEIINFFTLHIEIVALPLYHVARKTFEIYPMDCAGTVMIFLVYHYWLCLPLSLKTGWNIDYMMCPPKQLEPLGQYYRAGFVPVCFAMGLLMRGGFTGATQFLFP